MLRAGALKSARRYRMGELSVIVTRDIFPNPGPIDYDHPRWHLSVQHPDRYPTWDELGRARDLFVPEDVWLCIPHPPRAYWFNLNPTTLHLVEIEDKVAIEQWKAEGAEAQRRGWNMPTTHP